MMTKEQSDIVKMVYHRFIDSEEEMWSDLDDNMEMISWLSDSELIGECKVKHHIHSEGIFRCSQSHSQEYCMAPYILEAVGYILSLYENSGKLHPKNAYILSYYLTMSGLRMIFVSETSSAI